MPSEKLDLLEVQPTPNPKEWPHIDMGPTEALLSDISRTLRNLHPNQRAIVILANGSTTFPDSVSTEVFFLNQGRRVKSHWTYVSNNTDFDLYLSWDTPVTNPGAGFFNGQLVPHGQRMEIANEITHLYLLLHGAAGGVFTLNNYDQAHPVIRIDAFTNPEEGLS